MFIQNLPWPPILLGLAAALSILVIYDLAYVYPLSRRWSAVAERCRLLEQMFCDLPSLTAQIELLANKGRSDLTQIGDRLGQLELVTESHSYEQAITGAARGEDAERLISCFGLTEGEAKLVTLLHGVPRTGGERRAA
jgi:Protein of unknown function (DUF2802)